ncbi:MAG: DEAD/DEAH box helicase [Phycisphaerales bacterium]|nr:DEAD/DEAH box helicase [Phycisphaerales bacterium]
MSTSIPSPSTSSASPSTTTFTGLNLAEPIMRALADEGYSTPTPIQAQAIPLVLAGRDVLGCAQTGTGKTAAFALPIIHRLLESPAPMATSHIKKVRVLVLSPTRELATQIADSFKTYGKHTRLSGAVIYGGVSQRMQERSLHRGVDVIVATPGRLIDLTEQGLIDYSGITTFVLDEADRMLDMGFINPIRQIAGHIKSERQTLLFSATMPREIEKLAASLLRNPTRVAVTPVASAAPMIEQSVYYIGQFQKQALLETLVSDTTVRRAVVFTRTKHGADRVCKKLEQAGVAAVAIHGNKNQSQRQRSLDSFRSGRNRVLVATDVAARGLDVDGITHVFNFDLPMEPEAYVHRIGRTGRAGATGIAVAFCDPAERRLLRAIERTTGKPIKTSDFPANFSPNGDSRFEHPNATDRDMLREMNLDYRRDSRDARDRRPSRSQHGAKPVHAPTRSSPEHIPAQTTPPMHNHRPAKPHHPHAAPHKAKASAGHTGGKAYASKPATQADSRAPFPLEPRPSQSSGNKSFKNFRGKTMNTGKGGPQAPSRRPADRDDWF